MASIPFAFSVHHFVSSVGADAGFAAIIGLAILVFLYFAQARETASLRHQAEEAADHVQQLELRVAQLSRGGAGSGTITPPPAPAPPGIARPAAVPAAAAATTGIAAARTGTGAPAAARAASPTSAPAGVPAAPAGVGAPALSSATRLIPISETDPATAYTNGGPAGPAVVSPAGPAPATAAAGATVANGASGSGATTAPPPARAAGRPPARPPAGRPPAPARRPAGTGGRNGGSSGGSRISRGFIILLSLLGIVAVVVVLLVVTSGGGSSSQSTSTPAQNANATSHRARTRHPAAVAPASVTVAVLNGTSIANLAHDVGQRLGAAGFKEGNLATAADQTQTATVVGYLPGHKEAALLVAKSLKLGPASVQPVDQSNRAVACPGSTPCAAKVVVTVGSDLASTQTS